MTSRHYASGPDGAFYRRPKLTGRDRDLIREIFRDTPATRRELALVFEVSRQTILSHTDYKRV